VAIPATWRWKLQTGAGLDLTPSMHWPAPIVASDIEHERGPILVRRRDGAYSWGVFEDTADQGRMVETFLMESWLEHLRQHERVTNADRVQQETIQQFQTQGAPKITHLIAADRRPAED